MVKRQWADRQRPSPLRPLRVQLSQRESPWRNRRALRSTRKLYRTAKASLMREVASPSGLDGRSSYPNYSFSRTSCGSSLKEGAPGETGKLCALPRNFAALPKPPSMREVASRSDDGRSLYLNYSFSRTSCGSSLKEGASGETRKLCGLPGNFPAMPRALPLRKDFPRPGEDVA